MPGHVAEKFPAVIAKEIFSREPHVPEATVRSVGERGNTVPQQRATRPAYPIDLMSPILSMYPFQLIGFHLVVGSKKDRGW